MRLYTYLAAALVRALVTWCTTRGRYVDYIHAGRAYMRRYVLWGHRTGDPEPRGLRAWLPNLYLHHIQAPDADEALHDHPWPWAVSWIVLGGYREHRQVWSPHTEMCSCPAGPVLAIRWHRAPALNFLTGHTFHRIAKQESPAMLEARDAKWWAGRPWAPEGGTWTLFLAGPRRNTKGWGYIVPGRGYVPNAVRHRELDATVRTPELT